MGGCSRGLGRLWREECLEWGSWSGGEEGRDGMGRRDRIVRNMGVGFGLWRDCGRGIQGRRLFANMFLGLVDELFHFCHYSHNFSCLDLVDQS